MFVNHTPFFVFGVSFPGRCGQLQQRHGSTPGRGVVPGVGATAADVAETRGGAMVGTGWLVIYPGD